MPRSFEHQINVLYHIASLDSHQSYLSYNVYDLYKQTLLDAYVNTNHINFKIHHELSENFGARVMYNPKNSITNRAYSEEAMQAIIDRIGNHMEYYRRQLLQENV